MVVIMVKDLVLEYKGERLKSSYMYMPKLGSLLELLVFKQSKLTDWSFLTNEHEYFD